MAQYSTVNVVFGELFAAKWVLALKTVPGGALLATGKLRLSKDPSFNPNSKTTLAELEANECDFSGYPAGGIAVSLTAGLDLTPQIQGAITSGTFVAATASPFVPNTATGYWIDDGTDPAMMEKFATPFNAPFAEVGNFLVLNAALPMGLLQPATNAA